MLDELKNILFQNKDLCYLCKETSSNKKPYICIDCYENLEIAHGKIDVDSTYIKEVYYSVFYNRFIREKISEFKFSGKNYLYKAFGEIMVDTVRKIGLEKEIDLIFYIPCHRRKEALRGYNQGELLGEYISKSLKIPLSKGNLIKTKKTKNQSGLNKIDRRLNLQKSFKLMDGNEIRGKKILLVDDIITTGTTLEECSRILIQSGGRKVVGVTLTSTKI